MLILSTPLQIKLKKLGRTKAIKWTVIVLLFIFKFTQQLLQAEFNAQRFLIAKPKGSECCRALVKGEDVFTVAFALL